MFVCPCVCWEQGSYSVCFSFCTLYSQKHTSQKRFLSIRHFFLFVLLALVASLAAGLPHPSKNKTFENDIHTTDVMFSYRTRIRYSIQVHVYV